MVRSLDEYVIERCAEAGRSSVFGLERDGEFRKWLIDLERIDLLTASSKWVLVTVPTTETGIKPSFPSEHPYAWSGKINEYAAELSVWWAFELLTEDEAEDFLRKHRPLVIFEYAEFGKAEILTARYDGSGWTVDV